MESGMVALNKIKDTRNRFLAMQKSSKEIFEESIAKINELKRFHEQITGDKLLLEKQKSTIPVLETNNLLSDKRITVLETILNDKKQLVDEQEALLKDDQQNILSARSSYCDRVYKYVNENRTIQVQSTSRENSSRELNDLNRQIKNCENELRTLNKNILDTESSLNDLQALQKVQKHEEQKSQQLLVDKKETLRNLTQRVKHLKFKRKKDEVNHTINSLYHRNNNNTDCLPSSGNFKNEVSSYFSNSALKQTETLQKIKSLRALKAFESNSKSHIPKIDESSISNQDKFDDNAIKRCKVNENRLSSTNDLASSVTSSSSEDSNRMLEIQNVSENSRKKFIPKKPIFSSKLT